MEPLRSFLPSLKQSPEAGRTRFNRFFNRQTGQLDGAALETGRAIHAILLDSVLTVRKGEVSQRRASISTEGSPVVYSLKLSPHGASEDFRMICEPGGVFITVAEQVELSRKLLRELCLILGWHEALAVAETVLAQVIPEEPGRMNGWWGGLWLGTCIGKGEVELRAYANLRDGGAISRWQRVANLLAPFAGPELMQPVRAWMDDAGPLAIPVGVGVVLTGEGSRRLRIYLGVENPSMDQFRRAHGCRFLVNDILLGEFCRRFEQAYGDFARQSVTLGYDFCGKAGELLDAEIARFKVDISFGHLAAGTGIEPAEFVEERAEAISVEAATAWREFIGEVSESFPKYRIEYASLGSRGDRVEEMTVYVAPEC